MTGTHCFRVDAHLSWGAPLLLIGVVLSVGGQYAVWHLCKNLPTTRGSDHVPLMRGDDSDSEDDPLLE